MEKQPNESVRPDIEALVIGHFLDCFVRTTETRGPDTWRYIVPIAEIEAAGILPEEFIEGNITTEVKDEILDHAILPELN